jgi:hypothetical protein
VKRTTFDRWCKYNRKLKCEHDRTCTATGCNSAISPYSCMIGRKTSVKLVLPSSSLLVASSLWLGCNVTISQPRCSLIRTFPLKYVLIARGVEVPLNLSQLPRVHKGESHEGGPQPSVATRGVRVLPKLLEIVEKSFAIATGRDSHRAFQGSRHEFRHCESTGFERFA